MTFQIYTDGYFDMNDQVGSSAVVILDSTGQSAMIEYAKARQVKYDPEKKQRINEQEVGACIRALMLLPDGADCVIYSDSQYAVNVLNKTWEAKANLELIDRFYKELTSRNIKCELKWVRGHNGDFWNERADELCEKVAHDLRVSGKGFFHRDYTSRDAKI